MPDKEKRPDWCILQSQGILWATSYVRVWLKGDPEIETGVRADVLSYLCVHKETKHMGSKWTITHVPTGLKIVDLLMEKDAKAVCEYLISRFIYPLSLDSKEKILSSMPIRFKEWTEEMQKTGVSIPAVDFFGNVAPRTKTIPELPLKFKP